MVTVAEVVSDDHAAYVFWKPPGSVAASRDQSVGSVAAPGPSLLTPKR